MVLVRCFEAKDPQALANLMTEMAHFYGATINSDLLVAEDVIQQAQRVNIIVAHGDTGLLGFATFTPLYPVARLLAFTYVQQVYVGQTARRLGVAQKLMAEIARVSKAKGSTRIEWSTGRDNTAGRRLYDGLGANGSEKVYYVLEGAAFEQLAAQKQ